MSSRGTAAASSGNKSELHRETKVASEGVFGKFEAIPARERMSNCDYEFKVKGKCGALCSILVNISNKKKGEKKEM